MKNIIIVVVLLLLVSCTPNRNKIESANSENYADFIATIDMKNATKDGVYLNGYVVNIDYIKTKELNGKKVNIKGDITIEKGIENDNFNSKNIIRQGRQEDTKHILNPKIEIVE